VDSFTASDGIGDFTDPWKKAPVLLRAMGSMRRY
jgi:hypothetical protein